VISAPFLSEEAEVKKFERRAGYFLLEVILRISRTYKQLRISEAQLEQLNVVTSDTFAYTSNSEDFFFWIEANILRLAYQFDPLLAVNYQKPM